MAERKTGGIRMVVSDQGFRILELSFFLEESSNYMCIYFCHPYWPQYMEAFKHYNFCISTQQKQT